MSKTQTNQFGTDTGTQQGVFGNVKTKDIEYQEQELPSSMMKAIRIVVRLLTQSKFHEKHVLYMNYPPVDIVKKDADEDEDEDPNANRMMNFGGDKKKKDDEKKEDEAEINKEDEDGYQLIHLFKFTCDLT